MGNRKRARAHTHTMSEAKSDSFVTPTGKVHLFSNKLEVAVQILCVIVSLVGMFMVAFKAHDEHDAFNSAGTYNALFADYKSIGYTFASGSFLCIALAFNAGAHLPITTPLLMGLGYFYFGNAIARTDTWRQAKEDNLYAFDDYDILMAGACLSLIATSVACIFEISIPGSGKGRASGCGAPEVAAILFLLIGIAGLLVMWIKNDVTEGTIEYTRLQKLSVESVISLMFLADSLMHFDPDISAGAILIGTLTGCNMFLVGIEYETIPDQYDDMRIARQGALVTAISIAVLVVVGVLASALGRNVNEEGRRGAFSRS